MEGSQQWEGSHKELTPRCKMPRSPRTLEAELTSGTHQKQRSWNSGSPAPIG